MEPEHSGGRNLNSNREQGERLLVDGTGVAAVCLPKWRLDKKPRSFGRKLESVPAGGSLVLHTGDSLPGEEPFRGTNHPHASPKPRPA